MKYLALAVVGLLMTACGGRNKGPSYFAQGQRILELGSNNNAQAAQHSRLSARLSVASEQSLVGHNGFGNSAN